ncbi:MAG: UDP-2,3-diacylglucosamine diphosphatase [Gammaproteobacteria bacterium]|nr:UDP-2,3-diacylglucosamine diphosphatase [Gammaproteobacteria bacterium]
MTCHFISDLHLSSEQPHLLRLFEYYLDNIAPNASEIFILGDLFEVWIGDDYRPEWLQPITQKLKTLNEKKIKVAFCHGNRDFLVGQGFCDDVGIQLMSECTTIQLDGTPTLLCHGDSLCIDDVEYIAFRNQVRTQQWQKEFLSLSIEQRLKIVNDYREQSAQATSEKNEAIMDVNQSMVRKVMQQENCQLLIHGHTHRPAQHEDSEFTRLVLSDWYDYGHFLLFENGHFDSIYFNGDSQVHSWQKP